MLQIDSREPEKMKNAFKLFDIEHEVVTLPIADYVYADTAIERKTIEDFANSIRKGHLQKQLLDMEANYKNCYLIISGSHSEAVRTAMQSQYNYMQGWTVEHHLGAIASVAVRYRVKIVPVENDNQLVKMIIKIIQKQYDGKVVSKMDTELMLIKNDIKIEDVKVRMLAALPKISVGRAHMIAEHVDVRIVRKGTNEPIEENALMCIDGIGEVLASEICSVNKMEAKTDG